MYTMILSPNLLSVFLFKFFNFSKVYTYFFTAYIWKYYPNSELLKVSSFMDAWETDL